MKLSNGILMILRASFFLPLVLAAPSFVSAQAKAPAAKAPAPKPSAPHPAAPHPQAAQHPPAQTQHTPVAKQPHAPAAQNHPAPQNHAAPQTHANNTPAAGAKPGAKPGAPASAKPGPANTSRPANTSVAGRTAPGTHPGGAGTSVAGSRTPAKQVSLRGGGTAQVGSNGQIHSVNRNGMQIQHNLHGGRTTVSQQNGKKVVSTGKNNGYVQSQKPYATQGGKSYYSRTSYNNGQASTASYRGYNYGGQQYYAYQPSSYYSPAFYGWAGDAWSGQISFGVNAWGWDGSPWLGYYGFTPYPVYAGPAYWLTDYLIAANLQSAYAALSVAPVVVGSPGLNVNVIANQAWTDTGMPVVQGQTYTVSAGGAINFNPQSTSSPEGVNCGGGHGPFPQFPCISMIGKISPMGAPFYVGNGLTFTAPFTGELYLGVNDGYLPDNSGAWQASISQAGAVIEAPAPAVATGMPPTLNECEGGACGVWTWNGSGYTAQWNNGSIGVLSVVRWDGENIVLTRVDPGGTTGGIVATYSGRIVGPTAVAGMATYSWPGHPGGDHTQGWSATSPTPISAGASAPAPVAIAASASVASQVSGADQVALTPEVKYAVAEEVKAQLADERAAAQHRDSTVDDVLPALDPARRTFVVSSDLTVVADGQECSLAPGDVITRIADTPDANQKLNVSIASSKKSDCAQGQQVAVSLDDLQEMRNQLHQKLDAGLKSLASKQGNGKIPKAPDTSTTASNVPKPSPDPAAAQTLQQQQTSADQTEAEVKQEVAGTPPGGK